MVLRCVPCCALEPGVARGWRGYTHARAHRSRDKGRGPRGGRRTPNSANESWPRRASPWLLFGPREQSTGSYSGRLRTALARPALPADPSPPAEHSGLVGDRHTCRTGAQCRRHTGAFPGALTGYFGYRCLIDTSAQKHRSAWLTTSTCKCRADHLQSKVCSPERNACTSSPFLLHCIKSAQQIRGKRLKSVHMHAIKISDSR